MLWLKLQLNFRFCLSAMLRHRNDFQQPSYLFYSMKTGTLEVFPFSILRAVL